VTPAVKAILDATGLDLGAIRERSEAATPGPWETEKASPDRESLYYWIRQEKAPGSRTVAWITGSLGEVSPTLRPADYPDDAESLADAAFISAARTDVPALLAAVEGLAAKLSAVDERAMRAALAGGCCARHVAMGVCVEGACGPLTRADLVVLTEAATERLVDCGEDDARAVLVLCATLAPRLP
jgi:hypothetical protein